MEDIFANIGAVVSALYALVLALRGLAAVTPWKWDDKAIAWLAAVLKALVLKR